MSQDIVALEIETGEQLWRLNVASGDYRALNFIVDGYPLVAGDTVYAFRDPMTLVALDRETGQEFWSTETRVGVLAARPTTLYVGGEGKIIAFDPEDGARLWERVIDPEGHRTMPVVSGDIIYVTFFGDQPPYRD